MKGDDSSAGGVEAFLQRCLCLDLECGRDGRIFHAGAALGERSWATRGGISKIEEGLEELARNADFILGHNIAGHDLPVLRRASGRLERLFRLPVIDTLYLSPLAFPENPYHALIKDYKLVRSAVNDPVADARLAAAVFVDQWRAFAALNEQAPGVVAFYRLALEQGALMEGVGAIFERMGVGSLSLEEGEAIYRREASRYACHRGVRESVALLRQRPQSAPMLAYALAWLRVSGSRSVLPPWVRGRFPEIVQLLRTLRDLPCSERDCRWCHHAHDPCTQLQRFFGFEAFRPEPATAEGGSLQERIVAHGMREEPLLAILPTGGGKSLCFQVPALARNDRRGVLTVVISPLQALMKDQVDNLTRLTGTPFAGAIYGMLTPPERGTMLEKIRLGDIAILYLSPEQLRNVSIRETLRQREIGAWVFDEAHCFSKWGHDFRPDYLYASRFIREFAQEQQVPIPPVACFTATAKSDVREEIISHFRRELGQELLLFDGGAERQNLAFEIQTISASQKWERTHEILAARLPPDGSGSAVIYAATQKGAEEAAAYLKTREWRVEAFHAGIDAAEKRRIQESFISGETRIICATNAFGMGIDKDNVRLVLHLDIPGSLENYLQEAGRAGRDRQPAECLLLFDEHDIEKQFKLGAHSQLTRKDIAQILRGLRTAKRDEAGNVIVTSGELLRSEEVEVDFHYGDRNADTKVRTAIAVLEKSGFIERNQNRTRVFQGSPLVANLEEARVKIEALHLPVRRQKQWLAVLELLINSRVDDAISADQVAELPEFFLHESNWKREEEGDTLRVLRTLHEMAEAGLIRKDLLLTAFVRHKVVNPSWQILEKVGALERAMLDLLRMEEPDPEGWMPISLSRLNQRLLDLGHTCVPAALIRLLGSLARDGKGMAERQGSLELRHRMRGQCEVKIQRSWEALLAISRKRQDLAKLVLDHLISKIPGEAAARADFLVEFSEGELHRALDADLILRQGIRNRVAAFEHALMYLHDQNVIILQQGLAIFRQAMTIRILPEARERRFTQGDFSQLDQHYQERTFQVHVMNEYARLGLEKVQRALAFVGAYFTLGKEEFLQRYFAGKREVLKRATGAESYRRIVESLHHPVQIAIVAARVEENMLVLAGPGSGKTRVVAHRCAYLLRVERVAPKRILILCFNRNAALGLRQRIADLAGEDARGVTVLTYHSLAMRLCGTSLAERAERGRSASIDFGELIRKAVALLSGGDAMPGAEPDELRDRLLGGYRHILVDEYQDIDADQYDLVSAIAGRTLADPESKLSILAVGDDDQNIYSFRGANVEFIRRFESDYKAKSFYLIENYRSSRAIIEAANHLIALNCDRMKTAHAIEPNKSRRADPRGGRWETLDPIARGQVQVFKVNDAAEQAGAVVAELRRLKALDPGFRWEHSAILGRTREDLMSLRAALEACGIGCNWGLDRDRLPPFHRIREVAQGIRYLKERRHELSRASELREALFTIGIEGNRWWRLLGELLEEWQVESDNAMLPVALALEFISEALALRQREPSAREGVFLSTIHSAKGMEFKHLFLLGGGWQRTSDPGQQEEERRLCYVAMTRARETLTLLERADSYHPHVGSIGEGVLVRRPPLDESFPREVVANRFELLSLDEVYLDFAGRQPQGGKVHQHLAALAPGTRLTARMRGEGVEFCDEQGVAVARLSARGREVWRTRLAGKVEIEVVAMIERTREEVAEEFWCEDLAERWEVPVVEIRWR